MSSSNASVGIIMGANRLPVMQDAASILTEFGIAYEITIVSAHRTPERMFDYARTAAQRGIKVIIAGAGGAAHLPGMTALHYAPPGYRRSRKIFQFHRWLGIPFYLSCKCPMVYLLPR